MSPARRWSVLCVLFLILAWLALPKGKEAPQPGATGSEAAIRTYPAVLTSGVPTHPKPTSSAPEARPAPDQPAVTASDEEPALPTGRKPANPNGWQGINRPTSKR